MLELEKEFLNEDLEKLQSKVAVLKKSFPNNIPNVNIDSLIFKLFSSQTERLIDDKNLREYYEFLFKYEDKVIPYKVNIQQIKLEDERIFGLNRDIKRKATQIQTKVDISQRINKRLFSLSILLIILIFIGWKMARYGFKQWREIVQKPVDEKLSIELEILKKSNTNIN
ncbi:MAG TPA: hypothetical protein PKZ75_13380 [Bacteroidia bacterium]|nr:hypothetical protein [Bacteroidia bacterium]